MMLKRLSIYFVMALMATSCYQYNKPEKPKNLLSKDQMVNILIDIKLLTSANGKNKTILENNSVFPEDYIYKKYNIDSTRFAKSNNYYAFYTEEYNDIYSRIKDSMLALKEVLKELDEQEEEERKKENLRKKDSLDAIKNKAALNPMKHRDSLIRVKDSIKKTLKIRDSLLKKSPDEGLIQPISDTDIQQ